MKCAGVDSLLSIQKYDHSVIVTCGRNCMDLYVGILA